MNIDTLKIKRRTLKVFCTRMKGYVLEVRDNPELGGKIIEHLKVRKDRLDGFWREYDDIQSQIELLEPDDNDREPFGTILN